MTCMSVHIISSLSSLLSGAQVMGVHQVCATVTCIDTGGTVHHVLHPSENTMAINYSRVG